MRYDLLAPLLDITTDLDPQRPAPPPTAILASLRHSLDASADALQLPHPA
mgnify:CR=1 FL=1